MSGSALAGIRETRVAVVGAGVAGLACARALAERAFSVRVFEREACPGGRVASRRLDALTFDYGVQYFTLQDPRFEPVVRAWQTAGVVANWRGRTLALAGSGSTETLDSGQRFVGVPNMEAVAVHLARGLDIRLGTEVGRLERQSGRWILRGPDGTDLDGAGFDWVVLAVPSPIAAPLLEQHSELGQRAATVAWDPCWAVMLALARPSAVDFDAAFVSDDPILGWIARESSKPMRSPLRGASESWILHAHPAWSRTYLELQQADAARWMQRAFAARVGRPLMQAGATAHRWRLALPVNPLPEPFLYDAQQGIGLAGDWCGGPRVEGAYLSGTALAHAIAS
ncbi:MAG: FAD-dependent oxidoreductase [Betaproteobacteria bacterium]|jgi:predicted NAD/FAD-dependent oxidoreductase|nr:MAG: FAD-dependent oxidoreductase [Betaproteobacteria bacterium]